MVKEIEMPMGPSEGEERSDMGRVARVARANKNPKEATGDSSLAGACEYLRSCDKYMKKGKRGEY